MTIEEKKQLEKLLFENTKIIHKLCAEDDKERKLEKQTTC